VAKLIERPERILPRAVGLMRRKEGNRRITPVIDAARRTILRVELKHRQQLDRRDAQVLEVRNFLDQASVGATLRLCDAGTGMAGEAPDVHLVDDGLCGGSPEGFVPF